LQGHKYAYGTRIEHTVPHVEPPISNWTDFGHEDNSYLTLAGYRLIGVKMW